ncbi:enoyl-CoA hydratase-related protein [Rhizobium rhizoryzae]|uniref:enoyl-CoA hydratase-related protein n=1 Tax=Rhizobium rhizoryzae TaxID=451876 RepID=UPI0028A16665|nr:enoyl-CoA hydratase-related protein [Rhizobium rhizoryzae]
MNAPHVPNHVPNHAPNHALKLNGQTQQQPEDDLIVSVEGRVATIRINRPQVLNALNSQLMHRILELATGFDRDPEIRALIIAGSRKAFAAGADIAELSEHTHATMYEADFFHEWDRFADLRLPKIAAVSGYALGGGCELAMMCDIVLASETARFGQPEVKIGCIPGMGGSQRLTRLVGRACAMDMILTGRMVDANEALRMGLVSRVLPVDELEREAATVAATIASYAHDIVMMARQAVNAAEETTLSAGLRYERQIYHGLYGSAAQREGMAAFREKRAPNF